MTVGEWLSTREPRPPLSLSTRLEEIVGQAQDRNIAEAPEVLMAAGENLVSALIRDGNTDRRSALDLLAADALVTYAFEAASEQPLSIEDRAANAIARIARLSDVVE